MILTQICTSLFQNRYCNVNLSQATIYILYNKLIVIDTNNLNK